jgi:hypothetical protein
MKNIWLTNNLKRISLLLVAACAISIATTGPVSAEDQGSKAELATATAAKQNKYTFIMFWKKKDNATSAMWQNLKSSLGDRQNLANYTQVRANDPAEATLVKKYGVSRAPMPLTLAIAPNGAITGSFVRRLNKVNVDKSFVSPAKAQCMKTLQGRKLVLLCVNPISKTGTPKGVEEFKAVPCYQKNAKIITLSSADPDEASFLKELEIPASSQVRNVVFMAPPGVLVGKYNGNVTKNQLVASLKKTGKGCGVEGCEHCK